MFSSTSWCQRWSDASVETNTTTSEWTCLWSVTNTAATTPCFSRQFPSSQSDWSALSTHKHNAWHTCLGKHQVQVGLPGVSLSLSLSLSKLLSRLAPLLGREVLVRKFVPLFPSLGRDAMFHVRKVCSPTLYTHVCMYLLLTVLMLLAT